jgi:hypothetical protein
MGPSSWVGAGVQSDGSAGGAMCEEHFGHSVQSTSGNDKKTAQNPAKSVQKTRLIIQNLRNSCHIEVLETAEGRLLYVSVPKIVRLPLA